MIAEHLNKDPSSASHWKGRVLVWLKAVDAKFPQAGKELCLNEPDSDDSEEETKGEKKGKGGEDEKEPLLEKDKMKEKKGET